jgi:hypothetical protein
MSSPTVPHHGPVTRDCPIECLLTVPLSLMSYNRLWWASNPPHTVGDVLGLYVRNELRNIRGLGRRRIAEIGTVLIVAGFDLAGHEQAAQARGT